VVLAGGLNDESKIQYLSIKYSRVTSTIFDRGMTLLLVQTL
jgi:hypothetical protein